MEYNLFTSSLGKIDEEYFVPKILIAFRKLNTLQKKLILWQNRFKCASIINLFLFPMFEKILEKVLLTYFGRFISGLDKNNLKLGVWSGNVVIENVNLKQELIEILELPLKLKMS